MNPRDHAANPRRALGNVKGEGGERLSEYFDFARWPEKATMRVTRLELLALLTQLERAKDARSAAGFFARLWRYMKRPVGAKPLDAAGKELGS